MTDWIPIKFPFEVQPGDYLRVDGDRFIRVDIAKNFQTAEELKAYVEQVTKLKAYVNQVTRDKWKKIREHVMTEMKAEQNVSPEMQFQVGEPVLYVPQGIYTTVTGYNWIQQMNGPPRLLGYQLSCGISARFKELCRPPAKELTKPSESV